jgi:hypothetical protein
LTPEIYFAVFYTQRWKSGRAANSRGPEEKSASCVVAGGVTGDMGRVSYSIQRRSWLILVNTIQVIHI